jgi:hypothetical protein
MMMLIGRKHKYHNEKHRSNIRRKKEVGRKANEEKTKHMFMSRHETAGHDDCIKVANKNLKKCGKFMFRNNGNKSELHS